MEHAQVQGSAKRSGPRLRESRLPTLLLLAAGGEFTQPRTHLLADSCNDATTQAEENSHLRDGFENQFFPILLFIGQWTF